MNKLGLIGVAVMFCTAFTFFIHVRADSYHVVPWEKRGDAPRKYCGNFLADILHLVCNGKYYSITSYNAENLSGQKKSSDDNVDNYWLQSLEEPSQEEFPFRSRLNSASMVRHRIFRRNAGSSGIVQECCVKGCTYSELNLYCANR